MVAPRSREREAKFIAEDPAALAGLAAHDHLTPGDYVQARATVTHVDTYYDTPAYALLRAGYALRLRQTSSGLLLGLKSLPAEPDRALHDRLEVETAWASPHFPASPEVWPAALAETVTQILASPVPPRDGWQPVAVVRQTRQKRDVSHADAPGCTLLELSLDHVEVVAPGPGQDTAPLATWDEVEVESRHASAQPLLDQWTRHLSTLDGLRPAGRSKFERALLLGAASPVGQLGGVAGIAPEMPVAEACRGIWRDQLLRMLLQEHRVRAEAAPEAVHQMRVAIRRMRAAHRIFGDYFRKRALRPHLRGLRQLGRLLGVVRDLDVGLENLDRFRKEAAKADRKAIKALMEELERRHAAAYKKLIAHLNSDAHAEFIVAFDRFCRTPGEGTKRSHAKGPEQRPTQVRHTLPSMVWTRFEHVRAYETLLDRPEPSPIATLHALRIEAKYLRYSLEFARLLLGKDGDRLITQLKQLQDHLGLLNDAQVELHRLEEWRKQLPDNPAVAARQAALDATTASLLDRYPPLLAQFVAPKNRTRLAKALAAI